MAVTGANRKMAGLFYDRGAIVRNVVHPDFGAKGDGSNDSQAFLNAIADLPANKGGIIVVPEPPGGQYYAVNIPITRSNVQIVMAAGTDGVSQNRLVPWDITQPVITVGDGSAGASAFQWGVRMRGVSLGAVGPNGQGQVGLKIAGAVHKCSYRQISINDFTKYGLRIESGANASFGSASRHYFDDMHIQCAVGNKNRALISLDYDFGGVSSLQYVTAIYFHNVGLNGSNWGVTGRTATSGAAGALNDSGASWTTNEWAGMAVIIVSGTGAGQTRDIASNTATQLVPTVNFTTPPDATSRYEIVGFCYESDGVESGFTDCYADVTSYRSFRHSKNGVTKPNIVANNLTIDGANSNDIVLQTDYSTVGGFAYSVGNYVVGTCNIDGYIFSADGVAFKPTGRQYLYNQPQITYPFIFGSITFGGVDTGDTTATGVIGPLSGHASTLQIAPENTLNLKPGTGLVQLVAPAGTATLTLFETTGSHTSTLRMTGGTVQLYSEAGKSIELRGGGATAASKLVVDSVSGPVLPAYTVATRPVGAAAGAIIFVSDGAAGAKVQAWDGSAWVNLG